MAAEIGWTLAWVGKGRNVKTLSGQKYDDTVITVYMRMRMRMWMRMMKKEWHGHYGECWSNGVRDWVAGRRNRRSWNQDLRTGSCTPFTLDFMYHCNVPLYHCIIVPSAI